MKPKILENNRVRYKVTLTESGSPVTPGSPTFWVKKPDGTLTSYASGAPEFSNPSAGVYQLEFDNDDWGDFGVQFTSTGPAKRTVEIVFESVRSNVRS